MHSHQYNCEFSIRHSHAQWVWKNDNILRITSHQIHTNSTQILINEILVHILDYSNFNTIQLLTWFFLIEIMKKIFFAINVKHEVYSKMHSSWRGAANVTRVKFDFSFKLLYHPTKNGFHFEEKSFSMSNVLNINECRITVANIVEWIKCIWIFIQNSDLYWFEFVQVHSIKWRRFGFSFFQHSQFYINLIYFNFKFIIIFGTK